MSHHQEPVCSVCPPSLRLGSGPGAGSAPRRPCQEQASDRRLRFALSGTGRSPPLWQSRARAARVEAKLCRASAGHVRREPGWPVLDPPAISSRNLQGQTRLKAKRGLEQAWQTRPRHHARHLGLEWRASCFVAWLRVPSSRLLPYNLPVVYWNQLYNSVNGKLPRPRLHFWLQQAPDRTGRGRTCR